MTKIQEYLAALPEDKKALFIPVFGSVDKFYTVVYLIIRNEHVTPGKAGTLRRPFAGDSAGEK